jgi:hypothetical protein
MAVICELEKMGFLPMLEGVTAMAVAMLWWGVFHPNYKERKI